MHATFVKVTVLRQPAQGVVVCNYMYLVFMMLGNIVVKFSRKKIKTLAMSLEQTDAGTDKTTAVTLTHVCA